MQVLNSWFDTKSFIAHSIGQIHNYFLFVFHDIKALDQTASKFDHISNVYFTNDYQYLNLNNWDIVTGYHLKLTVHKEENMKFVTTIHVTSIDHDTETEIIKEYKHDQFANIEFVIFDLMYLCETNTIEGLIDKLR